MIRLLVPLLLLVALPLLPAQILIEPYNYPPVLPKIPNWTVHTGTWAITKSLRLTATSGSLWAYITRDGLQAKDCVIEGEFHVGGTGLQFGGFCARVPANSNGTNLIMAKVQGSGQFDRIWVYERGGSSTTISHPISPAVKSLSFRMIVLDATMWCQVDGNGDGIYEITTPPKTVSTVLGTGGVGQAAYQTAEMDNFRYFDAVLWEPTGATPKVGTDYKMVLRVPAPSPTGPPKPYFCLASRFGKPIVVGTMGVPLGHDVFWELALGAPSIFANFNGLISKSGDVNPTFKIPNNPALVGVGLFFAGLTMDASKPLGLGHISNNLYVKIQA